MYYRRGSCCLGGCLTLPFMLLAAPFIWLFRPRRYWGGWGYGRGWRHHRYF